MYMSKQELMVHLMEMKAEKINAKTKSGIVCRKAFINIYRDDFYMTVHISSHGNIVFIQLLKPYEFQSVFIDKFANLEKVDYFIEMVEKSQ